MKDKMHTNGNEDEIKEQFKSSSKQVEQYLKQIKKNNLFIAIKEKNISKIIDKMYIVSFAGCGGSVLALVLSFIVGIQTNDFYAAATFVIMGGIFPTLVISKTTGFIYNYLKDDYNFERNIVYKKMRNNELYKQKIKELEDAKNDINKTVSKGIAPIDHTNDFDKEVSKKRVLKK